MFSQKENLVNRLVWLSLEGGPKPLPTPETSAEKLPPTGEALVKQKPPEKKVPQKPEDEPGHTQKLAQAEQKLDAAYQNPDSKEAREIPDQLKQMSRAQIRNLERTNPELLLKTCFWKIEEGDKLTPIANTGELKIGDKLRFNVPEANGKNKHLEMGAGLRVLPSNIKVVEIKGEKFFRISDGGPFVDKNGDYRAIRSHENETITLVESSTEDKKTSENLQKTRGREYASRDVSSALSSFLKTNGKRFNSENINQFLESLRSDPTATPEMLAAAKENAASIKKLASLEQLRTGEYQKDFINVAKPMAQQIEQDYGIPWQVTLAQTALETGFGKHVAGGNFFGIKGGGEKFNTTEFVNGKAVSVTDSFRSYASAAESFLDYARLLTTSKRYRPIVEAHKQNPMSPKEFLRKIIDAGYATDPNYVAKAERLMQQNGISMEA